MQSLKNSQHALSLETLPMQSEPTSIFTPVDFNVLTEHSIRRGLVELIEEESDVECPDFDTGEPFFISVKGS